MNFPKVSNSKTTNYYVCMALTIETIGGDLFSRKYYMVNYLDNTDFMFMTTDEPDSEYNVHNFDEDFIMIPNVEYMLDSFEKAEVKNLVVGYKFIGIPFYVHYNIVLIDDFLKPLILDHLNDSIDGFTKDNFSEFENKQLKLWINYLSKV